MENLDFSGKWSLNLVRCSSCKPDSTREYTAVPWILGICSTLFITEEKYSCCIVPRGFYHYRPPSCDPTCVEVVSATKF